MSSNDAFRPSGSSLCLDVSSVSTASPLQAPSANEPLCASYLVSNSTSQGCWLVTAQTAADAVAAIPTTGTYKKGLWVGGSSTQVLTFTSGCYFAAITPTGTTTLYITPGVGI